MPWLWLPLVIAWPPFAEGILEGNIQMLMFAAFVFLFYRSGCRAVASGSAGYHGS